MEENVAQRIPVSRALQRQSQVVVGELTGIPFVTLMILRHTKVFNLPSGPAIVVLASTVYLFGLGFNAWRKRC